MKFLSFLINFLLVVFVTVTALLVVVDLTVSATYIDSLASSTNSYQALSELLPTQIAEMVGGDKGNSSTSGHPVPPQSAAQIAAADQQRQQILAGMKAALTPDFIQTTLSGVLAQGEAAVKGNGTSISIPLDQVGVRARAAGLDVPSDQFKTLVIPADQLRQVKIAVHGVEQAKLVGLLAAGFLFLLSVFLSFQRGRYGALGAALIASGILVGVFAAAAWAAPRTILSQIDLPANAASFAPLIGRLVVQLAADLRLKFLAVALTLFVAGILLELFKQHLPHHQHPLELEAKQAKADYDSGGKFLDDVELEPPKK